MEFSVEKLYRFNQPKICGIVKKKPEYFKVTEINLFDPDGNGQHLFLRVTRKGLTTFEVGKILIKVFGTRPNSVGYAGLKDKVAVVTQVFSIKFDKDKLSGIETLFESYVKRARESGLDISLCMENFKLSLNSRKLRSGLLKGNSFEIVISNLEIDNLATLVESFRKVKEETKFIPNYYGDQRIGKRGKNAKEGYRKIQIAQSYIESLSDVSHASRKGFRSYLKKRKKSNSTTFVFDSFGTYQKFTAFQAALFNLTLFNRLTENKIEITVGDKVMSQFGGKVSTHKFEEESDKNNHLTFALPLIGQRVACTSYQSKLLKELNLVQDVFNIVGLDGGYRPCLLSTESLKMEIDSNHGVCEEDKPAVSFKFNLPKGSFATNVLREYIVFKEIE